MDELFTISRESVLYHQALADIKWLRHGFSQRKMPGIHSEYSLGLNGYVSDTDVKGFRQDFLSRLGFQEAVDTRCETPPPGEVKASTRLISVRQIHSALIHQVDNRNWIDFPKEGDGIFTHTPGLVLSILTADCMSILLVDRRRKNIAALHAGWRGTRENIPGHGADLLLREYNGHPEDCLAVVGPSIRSCCYQVGPEVAESFHQEWGKASSQFLTPDPDETDKFKLDLPTVARNQLLRSGFIPKNIFANPPCTSCYKDRFFSHRGDHGHSGRMMALIGIGESIL
jgi:polyphenol oxidase